MRRNVLKNDFTFTWVKESCCFCFAVHSHPQLPPPIMLQWHARMDIWMLVFWIQMETRCNASSTGSGLVSYSAPDWISCVCVFLTHIYLSCKNKCKCLFTGIIWLTTLVKLWNVQTLDWKNKKMINTYMWRNTTSVLHVERSDCKT